MTQAPTAQRMQELTELIHGHNARYYLSTPTISDESFDALVKELAQLRPAIQNCDPSPRCIHRNSTEYFPLTFPPNSNAQLEQCLFS